MKKMTVLTLSALFFLAASCQKENVNLPKTNKVEQNTMIPFIEHEGVNYVKYNGPDKACGGEGNRCGIIKITIRPALFTFSTFEGLNQEQTGELFNTADYRSELENFPTDISDLLQSGTVSLTFNYEDDNIINYIVGSTYPVTEENMEFALQLNKK